MAMLHFLVVSAAIWAVSLADYSCLCNYNNARKVFRSPDTDSAVIGYMNKYDCKKRAEIVTDPRFAVIEFQHKLGYVMVNTEVKYVQTCPGDPPSYDLLPTTTTTKRSTTLPLTTTTSTTTQTIVSTTPAPTTTVTKQSTSALSTTTPLSTTRTTPSSTTTATTTVTTKQTTTLPQTTAVLPTTQTPPSTTPAPTTATTTVTTKQTTTLPLTTTVSPTTQTTPSTTTAPTTAITKQTTTLPPTTTISSTTQTTHSTTPAPTTATTTVTTKQTTTLPQTTTISPTTQTTPSTTTAPNTTITKQTTTLPQTTTISPTTQTTPSTTPVPTTTITKQTTTLPPTATISPTTQTTPSTTPAPTTTITKQTTTLPPTTTVSPTTRTTLSTTPASTTTNQISTLPSTTTTSTSTQTIPSATPTPTTTSRHTSTMMSTTTTSLATKTNPSTAPVPTPTTTMLTTTLPSTTTPLTTTAAPLKVLNVSNSVLKYIGVGYNVLDANPGAMDITVFGTGRGLMADKRIFQLTQATNRSDGTAREVDETPHISCSKHNWSARFIHDGNSYQKELKEFIDFGNQSPDISAEAFLYNAEFNRVRNDTEGDSSTIYRDRMSTCNLRNMRYRVYAARKLKFAITRSFATDACKLPIVFTASSYMAFIDKWGTSIVMAADVGTMTVERSKTNAEAVLDKVRWSGHSDLIYPSEGYKGYGSSIAINATAFDKLHLPRFDIPFKTVVVGSLTSPVPIKIYLTSITAAFDSRYWTEVLDHQLYTDLCSGLMTESVLSRIRNNLNTALQQYVAYRRSNAPSFKALKEYPIQIPMVWPSGTYGLMKAHSGCPGGKVTWLEGSRKYDTEDDDPHNYYSSYLTSYLAGGFSANNIITDFCVKTVDTVDHDYTRAWPRGSYCLLKKSYCPHGFKIGFIFWDGEDESNSATFWGTLPDGEYSDNTKMYYCCRYDGSLSNAIFLPREKPFILIRYGSSCQTVYRMDVTEVYIRWDDEDTRNSDTQGGAHPYDDGGNKDHSLHFCHYRDKQSGFNAGSWFPGIIG